MLAAWLLLTDIPRKIGDETLDLYCFDVRLNTANGDLGKYVFMPATSSPVRVRLRTYFQSKGNADPRESSSE